MDFSIIDGLSMCLKIGFFKQQITIVEKSTYLKEFTMKKFACLFAALSLACAFTACGGDDNDDSPSKAGKGEACSAEVSCDEGLKCDADSKKCVEDKADEGDKAKKGEDCSKKDCADGLVCGDDKKCAEKPADDSKAKKGEDCSDKILCDEGLKCDDASKKCVEDKGGEGDVDCAALPKTAEAYKALAAIDAPESADKCETWMGGFQKVGLAAHEEKIVSSDQVNEEDLAKLLAALKECGKTWMPSGDKFDAGYKVCVEDAADSEEN